MAGDTSGQLELKTNNGTTAITVDTSQNVGIGLTPTAYKLSTNVASGDNTFGQYVGSSLYGYLQTSSSYVKVGTNAGTPVVFETNGTERMRIDSNGKFLIGKTAPSSLTAGWELGTDGKGGANFTQVGTNEIFVWNNLVTTGNAIVDFRTNGTSKGRISWDNSNTTYATSSDYRLKENIAPMTGALAKVSLLKPCTYTWKADGNVGEGFIAHELAEIVPDAVTGEKDGTKLVDIEDENGKVIGQETKPVYQGIDTSFLVATLTAAIQELNAKVTALEEQVINLGVK
jgi:hypothetical protein